MELCRIALIPIAKVMAKWACAANKVGLHSEGHPLRISLERECYLEREDQKTLAVNDEALLSKTPSFVEEGQTITGVKPRVEAWTAERNSIEVDLRFRMELLELYFRLYASLLRPGNFLREYLDFIKAFFT